MDKSLKLKMTERGETYKWSLKKQSPLSFLLKKKKVITTFIEGKKKKFFFGSEYVELKIGEKNWGILSEVAVNFIFLRKGKTCLI